jgi:CHRD domain
VLRSYNEVPSLSVPSAFGEFRLRTNDADQTILFAFRWSGLTGPPLFAHIHIGQVGVNGGVSAFLCGGSTKPVCPQSTSATITGSIGPDDVIGPSGQGVDPGEWGELVSAIRAGFAYANIHTSRFPGGEMRGQIEID